MASSDPSWQYRRLGRLEAEKMLVDSRRDGAFLVRESESMKGAHVLSLGLQGNVHHYRVMPSENGYYIQAVMGLQQKHFQTLEELVQFYKHPRHGLASSLNYPITRATGQEEDDDSDEDDDAESGDEFKMVKFFQASLSAVKLDQMDVDSEFIGWLVKYVNEGIARDVDAIQTDKRKLPEQFRQLVRLASRDIERELDRFGKRLWAMRTFLDRCTGGTHNLSNTDAAQQKKVDSGLESIASKFSDQATTVRNVEKKAISLLQQTATMLSPITQCVPTKEEHLSSAVVPVSQPTQTFEVQSIHAARVTKKGFLKVDVVSGKLFILKSVEDVQTPYTHDQILQLIKSRSHRMKLGVKLEGKGRRDFQFEDVKHRELFCQLVQQMRNMHSHSQEVDSVSVFIGTWNMGDAEPPHSFTSWLKCSGSGKSLDPILASLPHDIYAFGTQESSLNEREWVARLKSSLNVLVGVNFKQVAAQTLWGIRLVVLVKEEHFNKISHVQASTVKTGIAGVAGNKGGVGISFFFNGTSLCFINSHLTSGNERCQRRNNNFYDILRGLQVGQASRKMGGGFDLTHQCHHVFWFGDLNYRIEMQVEDIFECLESREYGRVLMADQLKIEQAHGRAFFGFEEEEIAFPPTYRYKRGTRGTYEYKKFKKTWVRINVPSYCDRVLLSSFPGTTVNNTSYGCTDDIMTSDHSPVFATYTLGITSQFIPASPSSELQENNERGNRICVKNIYAAIRTSSNPSFYLEIHSSCLENVIRSKRNIATSALLSRQWYGLPNGGQENAHYTYPEWTAAEFDQEIHPILPDHGYLEQQHLLIAVRSVEDDESYGECVVSLRHLIMPTPTGFDTQLTHRGMATGLLSGTMHLSCNESQLTPSRPISTYEMVDQFISNEYEDDPQLVSQIVHERSFLSSPQRIRSVRHKRKTSDEDGARSRSQSQWGEIPGGPRDRVAANDHFASNGFTTSKGEHKLRPTSTPQEIHFGAGSRRRRDRGAVDVSKGSRDTGSKPSSLDDSAIQVAFKPDSSTRIGARVPPPLPPRDDEPISSAPPLPLKFYPRDAKPSTQKTALVHSKSMPYVQEEHSSAPSSPTTVSKRFPLGVSGPQLGSFVASSVAQIAAQGFSSPVKSKVQAFEKPSKPPVAQKPRLRAESPGTKQKKETVSQWLLGAGLPVRYASLLVQSGWDDPNFFSDMSLGDLVRVGITSVDHQRKILEQACMK